TGFERHGLADERDEGRDLEQQIARAAVLTKFAVYARHNAQVAGVDAGDEVRPKRRERIEALATHPLVVVTRVAGGNIVATQIAKHVTERVGLGYFAAAL